MQWEIAYETQVKVTVHGRVEGVQEKHQENWIYVIVCSQPVSTFCSWGFLYIFFSSGLVFLNFTLQWFSLHAPKAEPRILQ